MKKLLAFLNINKRTDEFDRTSFAQCIACRLNSVWIALLMLITFIIFCHYCYPQPIIVTVPKAKQMGYRIHEVKEMNRFIKSKLDQYQVVQNSINIITIFDPKEQ